MLSSRLLPAAQQWSIRPPSVAAWVCYSPYSPWWITKSLIVYGLTRSTMTTFPRNAFYFQLLTHQGITLVSSETYINSSYTKALFATLQVVKNTITWLFYIQSSMYVLLLQIKSVAYLFWSHSCLPGWYQHLHKPSSGITSYKR